MITTTGLMIVLCLVLILYLELCRDEQEKEE